MDPAPLFVCFQTFDEFERSTVRCLADSELKAARQLAGVGLPVTTSVPAIATLFGLSPRFIGSLVRSPEKHYKVFTIPKGKKRRTIEAPRVGLKIVQKWLGHHLAAGIQLRPEVYGFVVGRSAPAAASQHVGAHWVYSLDIQNFFPSITLAQISTGLARIGYDPASATLLARLCCYQGRLSQGSPASPVLSNIVFDPIDHKLAELSSCLEVRYTRYADDLTFSGTGAIPGLLQGEIHSIIGRSGLAIAKHKERLAVLPQRLKVHGLLVHGDAVRLTKGYRNRIRAYKHVIENGISKDRVAHMRGHLAYADSVDRVAASDRMGGTQ